MPRLVLLNGPPGVGKSTVARLHVEAHPLALLLDIDELRRALGQWDRLDESRSVARDLACALADAHLRAGHDVVVPQYVGRIEFVERLSRLATDAGADFVEVVLWDDADAVVDRFRARRAALDSGPHPEQEIADADVPAAVDEAVERLSAVVAARPSTVVIPADPDAETAGRALARALRRAP